MLGLPLFKGYPGIAPPLTSTLNFCCLKAIGRHPRPNRRAISCVMFGSSRTSNLLVKPCELRWADLGWSMLVISIYSSKSACNVQAQNHPFVIFCHVIQTEIIYFVIAGGFLFKDVHIAPKAAWMHSCHGSHAIFFVSNFRNLSWISGLVCFFVDRDDTG